MYKVHWTVYIVYSTQYVVHTECSTLDSPAIDIVESALECLPPAFSSVSLDGRAKYKQQFTKNGREKPDIIK